MTTADRSPGTVRKRALAAVRWTTLWVVANKGLHAVTTIVLARSLAHEEFGAIALLTVALTVGTLTQELGTGAGLIYRRADPAQTTGFVLAFQGALGVVLAALTLAVADVVAAFFGAPVLAPALRALIPVYFLTPLVTVPLACLEKDLDYRGKVAVDLAGAVAQTVVMAGLALTGWGVWSFVAGTLAGKVVSAVVVWSGWRPAVAFAVTAATARDVLGYSRYVYGEVMLWFVSVNIDDVIVGRWLGPAALGVYKVGFATAVTAANSVGALTRVAFPAFASIRDDRPRLRQAFLRATEYCVMVGAPAFVLLGLLAEPVVLLVYGDRWAAAVPVLRVLAPYAILWLAATLVGDLFKATGAVPALFWINVGRVVLLVGCLLVAVRWGVTAVAVAVLAVAVVTRAAQFTVVSRLLALAPADYAATFGPTAAGCAATAAAVLALRASLPALPLALDVLVHGLAGGVAYVLTLLVVGQGRVRELVTVVRAAVGRPA